jgi:hypothetical protein
MKALRTYLYLRTMGKRKKGRSGQQKDRVKDW